MKESAKWHEEIDGSHNFFGFHQLVYVPPQLFYKNSSSGKVEVAAVKIVDDFLFTGSLQVQRTVVEQISSQYKIGTTVYSSGSFMFNRLRIVKDDESSITDDAMKR